MKFLLDHNRIEDYRLFLKAKALPRFRCRGAMCEVPDEYAHLLGVQVDRTNDGAKYRPLNGLFDYQRDIAKLAIRKRKFAVFMEPGYGKTLIDFEYARHAIAATGKRCLIVAPLMVVRQMIEEHERFYPKAKWPLEQVHAAGLQDWLSGDGQAFGITNYEAIREGLTPGNLGALILSESSMLKSMYGKWGTRLIELGRGLEWKLCETGTPAPNDRIEFANHAVFLDAFPTVNSFLARYFVNRGQTQERWEIKSHALSAFYRELSHWCIFVTNPATYGWKDNTDTIPPIHVHIHDIELTDAQREAVYNLTGKLFLDEAGGITKRAKLSRISKGDHNGKAIDTRKPEFVRNLIASWPDESTIIWCRHNAEQDALERMFPDAASIAGKTPYDVREILLDWFLGRICTCERQRRIASTCKRTTAKTSTDGISERQSSKPSTTPSDVPCTRPMETCNRKSEPKSEIGRPRTRKSVLRNDSKCTDSLQTNTGDCSPSKAAAAPYAEGPILETSGVPDCTSTIATTQDECEDFCATSATGPSDTFTTIPSGVNGQQCTCGGSPKSRILLSKADVLGFGLNLQVATRHVFNSISDSYEDFWQALKRSNRVGSSIPLNAHIPLTEVERPMLENTLRKMTRVQSDNEEQERIFKSNGVIEWTF